MLTERHQTLQGRAACVEELRGNVSFHRSKERRSLLAWVGREDFLGNGY